MLIAGIQMHCVAEKAVNVGRAEGFVREAASRGARFVCLQELFATQFFPSSVDAANLDLAEDDAGPTLTRLRGLAGELDIWLAAGVFERDPTVRGRYFNSVVLMAPSGDIVGRYRKIFLPLRRRNSERYYFTPGNLGVPVFDVDGLKVAFNICYDRHFPELARIAALEGADLLVIPAAALGDPGRINTWQAEMVSRAGENVFYVLGIGRSGVEDGRRYSGQSMLVDPYGRVLSSLGVEDEGIVMADVDPAVVAEARVDYAHLRDLRVEVYQRLLELVSAP